MSVSDHWRERSQASISPAGEQKIAEYETSLLTLQAFWVSPLIIPHNVRTAVFPCLRSADGIFHELDNFDGTEVVRECVEPVGKGTVPFILLQDHGYILLQAPHASNLCDF
jgi:hypothetical protein